MDATTRAAFSPSGATTQQSTVKGGSASAELVATESGTYTVVVTNGETVLASTTVTVAEAAPQPEPTVTHAAEHVKKETGAATAWIVVGVVVVLAAAGIVTWVIVRRKRAEDVAAES